MIFLSAIYKIRQRLDTWAFYNMKFNVIPVAWFHNGPGIRPNLTPMTNVTILVIHKV